MTKTTMIGDPWSAAVHIARYLCRWMGTGRIEWTWLFPAAAELDRRRRVAPIPPSIGSWR